MKLKDFYLLNRSMYFHVFLFILFLIVCFYDRNLSIAILLSISIACLIEPITQHLNYKYKIPINLIAFFYIFLLFGLLFFLIKLLIISFINQNYKLISLLNDKEFISKKIDVLHEFIEKVSTKLLFLKEKTTESFYSQKIDEFFDKIPDLIINKSIIYLKPIVEKSYIPGLKLLNMFYVALLTIVFSYYAVNDLNKIKKIPKIVFGKYTDKLFEWIKKIKNIIITIWINQMKVACILVVLYSSVMFFLKFDYFFIYAFCFGFFTMIPFLGALMSMALLLISCYMFDFTLDYSIRLFSVLMIGFCIENFFLTPKLVGESINSHPLSILIGLIILPQLFGFLGLMFTLPIVAILNSIISYIIIELKSNKA